MGDALSVPFIVSCSEPIQARGIIVFDSEAMRARGIIILVKSD